MDKLGGCLKDLRKHGPLWSKLQRAYLIRIQGPGLSGSLDCAEAAASGACVSHQHNRGCCSVTIGPAPAFSNVGAACLFADGAQFQLPQITLDFGELVTARQCPL